jgi:hypothetical protein
MVDLKKLQGRLVGLALADGTRIDECQLVSVRKGSPNNLWVFVNGEDSFVSAAVVRDAWEVRASGVAGRRPALPLAC